MARLKSPKQKGDAYERELADFFNAQLLPGVHRLKEFRRAPLSGGGVSDSTFDLTGTEVLIGRLLGQGEPAGSAPYVPEVVKYELGIEAKRTEKINVWEAMKQATAHVSSMASRGYGVYRTIPMVITRKNHVGIQDSLVVLKLSDLIRLIRGD